MFTCLRPRRFLLPYALLVVATCAHAQMEPAVRTEYAEVLRVEPVYLPAPHTGDDAQCAPMLQLDPAHPPPGQEHETETEECIPLPLGEATGRQVMYDVDYVLRGVKYRSRLPFDPGNRLQVRLSVTPLMPPKEPPSPKL